MGELAFEIGRNDQRHADIPVVDAVAHALVGFERRLLFENTRTAEAGDQLTGVGAAGVIEHREPDFIQIQRGGITQHKELDDRRRHQRNPRLGILEQLAQLLAQQGEETVKQSDHGYCSRLFGFLALATSMRTVVNAMMIRKFLTMLLQTLPTRKMVWRKST
ncbi:hypothetical protein SDC9_88971 [bioreactor metagenome]|uniref:Uncharacterized protein n=1 Tax=bioreactor metagenome TaxID=1076179 RepID=A0A644ZNH9_9ZZZZ